MVLEEGELQQTSVNYAIGFDIQTFKNYKKLIIKSPFPDATNAVEYFIVRKGEKIAKNIDPKKLIQVPIKKLVATSTTHIPMIELFNQEQTLKGFPNSEYISSERTAELVDNGHVAELGNLQDLNIEILVSLEAELLVAFAMDKNDPVLNKVSSLNIPILYNGDWLEETPLGRSEWLKVFGELFDRTHEADSIFQAIEKRYLEAKKLALKSKEKPTVISGVMFQDKWHLPAGESFTAALFKDANVDYFWKDSPGKGSLMLSFESVLDKGQRADLWIGSGIFTSYTELLESNAHYAQFDTFKDKKVFSFAKNKGKKGGIMYFEAAPLMPDRVLMDLVKAAHPSLLPDYVPLFLEALSD